MTIFTIALYTGFVALLWTFLEYAIKKTDNFFISLIKNWIGTFFIFSAVVKLVDPVGFSIKLDDYFEVFKMPFFKQFSLPLAFIILTLEFVLGCLVLFNALKKLTFPILLALILFFTLLTGVSAIFNVVQDCGCFGDFLKISPWTSFIKDIILSAMVILVMLNLKRFQPFFKPAGSWIVGGVAAIAALAFTLHNYFHLPIWDFRAYKVGTYIPEKMKEIAPPVYENRMTYKNKNTGEEQVFVNQFPNTDEWEYVATNPILIDEGIEAPIHDFTLVANNGEDLTEQILSFEKPILLIVVRDVSKIGNKGVSAIQAFIEASETTNSFNYAFLSSSTDAELEAYKETHGFTGTNLAADGTMLKTMVRSSPGFVLLQQGTIAGKWHYRDAPSPDDLLN